MKNTRTLLLILLLLTSCNNKSGKKIILSAEREAPLGWVYLRIFEDSSFEFEYTGIRDNGNLYRGNVTITPDTMYFHYQDSIPRAGSKAHYTNTYVSYTNGEYPESLSVN